MKKRKFVLALGMALLMAGCGEAEETAESIESTESIESIESTESTESTESAESIAAEESSQAEAPEGETPGELAEIGSLLGMNDSETKDMLGGGAENWTEDRSFYIGRIFQAQAYGETYPVYTTCSPEGIVEAVSMRIVNGERPVEEDEIRIWTERISAEAGAPDSGEERYSEGGSRQKNWRKDGKIVTMYYMEDNLTISFQKLVGELDGGTDRSDNFSVTKEEAAEFASRIKEAVAAKDQEMLAELAAYPLYIGFPDGSVSAESREEFMALDAGKLFSEELTASVAGADASALSPSEAGFILTKEKGEANIVFGLRNGRLAVSGINY